MADEVPRGKGGCRRNRGRSHHAPSASSEVDLAKQAVRERVWRLLEGHGVVRFPGAWGRIPNFQGAEAAARHLAATREWQRARVLKGNPDCPQLPVRARALEEGKTVYMAVPRLQSPQPFLRLDPRVLRVPPQQAASIRGAFRYGEPVGADQFARGPRGVRERGGQPCGGAGGQGWWVLGPRPGWRGISGARSLNGPGPGIVPGGLSPGESPSRGEWIR